MDWLITLAIIISLQFSEDVKRPEDSAGNSISKSSDIKETLATETLNEQETAITENKEKKEDKEERGSEKDWGKDDKEKDRDEKEEDDNELFSGGKTVPPVAIKKDSPLFDDDGDDDDDGNGRDSDGEVEGSYDVTNGHADMVESLKGNGTFYITSIDLMQWNLFEVAKSLDPTLGPQP